MASRTLGPYANAGARPNIIERAYELARSGSFHKVEHIARRLTAEGFTGADDHLSGRWFRRELNRLMKEAQLLLEAGMSNGPAQAAVNSHFEKARIEATAR